MTKYYVYESGILGINKMAPLIRLSETGRPAPKYYRTADSLDCVESGSPVDHEDILASTVPRLLLRRDLITREDWGTYYIYVLADFKDLVSCIRAGMFMPKIVIGDSRLVYGISRTEIEKILKAPAPHKEAAVLLATIARLDAGHALMAEYKRADDPRLELAAQLFIDTHADLCNEIAMQRLYTDKSLMLTTPNTRDLKHSVYEMCYPHDVRFCYCGDMPNLSAIANAGNVMYYSPLKTNGKTIIDALKHIFSSKSMMFRCQKRNYWEILEEQYFPHFPDIREFYIMCVKLGLLGNYGFVQERPTFNARLRIYAFFSDLTSVNTKLAWMRQNPKIVKQFAIEYHTYICMVVYTHDLFHLSQRHQKEITAINMRMSDWIRRVFSNTPHVFVSPDDFEADENIQRGIKNYISDMEMYISKLRKGVFNTVILLACSKIYKKHICDPTSTACLDFVRLVGREAYGAMIVAVNRFYIIEGNPIGSALPIAWLKTFGVSQRGYSTIWRLYCDYEIDNVADNKIEEQLRELASDMPRDFHIIHAAYHVISEFKECIEYPLPEHMVKQQESAIRAKYKLAPWQKMPEYASIYHICTACKNWAHDVITDAKKNNQRAIYSLGTRDCIHDIFTDEIFCGKEISTTKTRELVNKNIHLLPRVNIHPTAKENARDAKLIIKFTESCRCSATPLKKINMLGKVVYVRGIYYACCTMCYALTRFTSSNFDAHGFTCGCHNTRALARVLPVDTRSCFYCKSSVAASAERMLLYDDMNGGGCGFYYTCQVCTEAAKYVREQGCMQRLSIIFKAINDAKLRTRRI